MVSTLFRVPQALSSTLVVVGMPQSRALRTLNCVDPSVKVSNYYSLFIELMVFPLYGGLSSFCP